MQPEPRSASPQSAPPSLIIEVEGYDGEEGRIVVENDRAHRSHRYGVHEKLYCIGQMDDDGVIRFNDWGYATADEAREALGAERRARLSASADATPPAL